MFVACLCSMVQNGTVAHRATFCSNFFLSSCLLALELEGNKPRLSIYYTWQARAFEIVIPQQVRNDRSLYNTGTLHLYSLQDLLYGIFNVQSCVHSPCSHTTFVFDYYYLFDTAILVLQPSLLFAGPLAHA